MAYCLLIEAISFNTFPTFRTQKFLAKFTNPTGTFFCCANKDSPYVLLPPHIIPSGDTLILYRFLWTDFWFDPRVRKNHTFPISRGSWRGLRRRSLDECSWRQMLGPISPGELSLSLRRVWAARYGNDRTRRGPSAFNLGRTTTAESAFREVTAERVRVVAGNGREVWGYLCYFETWTLGKRISRDQLNLFVVGNAINNRKISCCSKVYVSHVCPFTVGSCASFPKTLRSLQPTNPSEFHPDIIWQAGIKRHFPRPSPWTKSMWLLWRLNF